MKEFNAIDDLNMMRQNEMEGCFSELIKEINESFSRILQLVVLTAETIESTFKTDYSWANEKDTVVPKKELESRSCGNKNNSKNYFRASVKNQLYDKIVVITPKDTNKKQFDINTLGMLQNGYEVRDNNNEAKTEGNGGLAISANINNITCEECGYSTTQQIWLDRHIKGVHKKLKDFSCSECSYASAWKSHLTRHRKTCYA